MAVKRGADVSNLREPDTEATQIIPEQKAKPLSKHPSRFSGLKEIKLKSVIIHPVKMKDVHIKEVQLKNITVI